jgi:integrase
VYRIESGRDAGKWIAQVDLGWTDTGTRIRPRKVRATEREAKAALKLLLERRQEGVRRVTTVHEWLDYWLADVIAPHRSTATLATYTGAMRWAKAGLSNRVGLLDLKPQHIRQLQATMRTRGASEARIHYVTTILGITMRAAIAEQMLIRSPVQPVLDRMERPETTRRKALTWAAATAAVDATTDPRTRARLAVGFMAGLRPSEAIGLRWEDIDLATGDDGIARGVLRVRGQIGRHGDDRGERVKLKTRRSRRDIPLEPVAASILTAWSAAAPVSPWVFPGHGATRPVSYDTDRAAFVAALKATGAPVITPHGARATFTSRLLDRGVSVAVAARLLGDLPETLIKHYARSSEGIEREAMRALEG